MPLYIYVCVCMPLCIYIYICVYIHLYVLPRLAWASWSITLEKFFRRGSLPWRTWLPTKRRMCEKSNICVWSPGIFIGIPHIFFPRNHWVWNIVQSFGFKAQPLDLNADLILSWLVHRQYWPWSRVSMANQGPAHMSYRMPSYVFSRSTVFSLRVSMRISQVSKTGPSNMGKRWRS